MEYNFVKNLLTKNTRENAEGDTPPGCVKLCDKPEMTIEKKYMSTVLLVLYLVLYGWAFLRAISVKVNKSSHVLLAMMFPTIYLLLSYYIDNFN